MLGLKISGLGLEFGGWGYLFNSSAEFVHISTVRPVVLSCSVRCVLPRLILPAESILYGVHGALACSGGPVSCEDCRSWALEQVLRVAKSVCGYEHRKDNFLTIFRLEVCRSIALRLATPAPDLLLSSNGKLVLQGGAMDGRRRRG